MKMSREAIMNGINGYKVSMGDYITMVDWIEYLANY